MRRAAKVDIGQPETVAYLRGLGWHVAHTHRLGQGFPDFLCSRRMNGIPWACLVELKSPGGKLTKDEQRFAEEYLGPLIVAYGPEDAAEKLLAEANHHWLTFGRGRD